jgi:hypothetical protein
MELLLHHLQRLIRYHHDHLLPLNLPLPHFNLNLLIYFNLLLRPVLLLELPLRRLVNHPVDLNSQDRGRAGRASIISLPGTILWEL